ncbi:MULTISPECIES: hypothetical protein [Gammaproteobacteria]|uniref:hypothetical protein n=1 Tax=Gammaproteobacteria TaxID=1236 RepID=UPI001866F948|nr:MULTISPECIES: hypothetical protein [Gammaproteobacteria]
MKKKFIIGLNSTTEQQIDEIKKFVKSNGFGWWSWLNNFWLLTSSKEDMSASFLRDKLQEICPGTRMLVIEMNKDGDTWSGFGPNSENKDMFKWMNEEWGEDFD